jgi:3D-(3,5/4)-trihydroxycyclohexane-1,2-dione acylhydrolase (decyclizing)
VHIETDPMVPAPDSEAWWDVPVAEVSALEPTQRARDAYEKAKPAQRPFVGPEPGP